MVQPRSRQGHEDALLNLAWLYANGAGVEMDEPCARELYLLAAEQGVAAAQFALGKLLMGGRQVARDDVVALQWLTLAQANGNKRAEEYIRHLVGRMTPEQLAQARESLLRTPTG